MRQVVPVRLSDGERSQIAAAATRLELTLSGFVRQAALEASARVEKKVVAVEEKPPVVPRTPRALIVDTEPAEHWVDGERVR